MLLRMKWKHETQHEIQSFWYFLFGGQYFISFLVQSTQSRQHLSRLLDPFVTDCKEEDILAMSLMYLCILKISYDDEQDKSSDIEQQPPFGNRK